LVSLREQGSIYFVPFKYKAIIDSVAGLVTRLGGDSRFDFVPIPDIDHSRETVRHAFTAELAALEARFEKDIQPVLSGQRTVTVKWYEHKTKSLKAVVNRIKQYQEILEGRQQALTTKFTDMAGRVEAATPSK